MKVKTALKQSKASAKFLSPICTTLVIALVVYPSLPLAIITGILVLYLAMDIYNIIGINRRARQDKEYLEERIDT